MSSTLTPQMASRFVAITLGHVAREYPNKPDHVLNGPEDLIGPRAQHPIFYGSFDWHGCVLGYWLLTRLYRRLPALPEAGLIYAMVDEHFTEANVAAELAYLAQPLRGTFERPYGWGWFLLLASELARHASVEGRRWSKVLAPLTETFAQRLLAFLPKATYPVRTGTHSNTAFAFALALEYAQVARDRRLKTALADKALAWYERDADCQAWEPSGEDFLSPALVEAECMRRVLSAADFAAWLQRFLPRLSDRMPATLFTPAAVTDRTDGKIVHLDGLNLSRAWCWRALAGSLDDGRRALASEAAEAHVAVTLPHLADHYMGEHWLATYALLALDFAGAEN